MSEGEQSTRVSAQLREIAAYLIEVAEQTHMEGQQTHRSAIPLRHSGDSDDLLALSWLAQEELRERRRRSSVLDPELFGEPAWDILLDLFVSRVNGKKISITSACIASGVPSTTALRWLTVLEQRGLIRRQNDEFDQRRNWVVLADHAFRSLAAYLRQRSSRRMPQFIGIGRHNATTD